MGHRFATNVVITILSITARCLMNFLAISVVGTLLVKGMVRTLDAAVEELKQSG